MSQFDDDERKNQDYNYSIGTPQEHVYRSLSVRLGIGSYIGWVLLDIFELICLLCMLFSDDPVDQLFIWLVAGCLVLSVIATIWLVCYEIISESKKQDTGKSRNTLAQDFADIDNMSKFQLAHFVLCFFKCKGFSVCKNTTDSDFVVKIDGKKFVVDCYKTEGCTGVNAVEKIVNNIKNVDAVGGWVITTASHFSAKEQKYAKEHNVTLFTMREFKEKVQYYLRYGK